MIPALEPPSCWQTASISQTEWPCRVRQVAVGWQGQRAYAPGLSSQAAGCRCAVAVHGAVPMGHFLSCINYQPVLIQPLCRGRVARASCGDVWHAGAAPLAGGTPGGNHRCERMWRWSSGAMGALGKGGGFQPGRWRSQLRAWARPRPNPGTAQASLGKLAYVLPLCRFSLRGCPPSQMAFPAPLAAAATGWRSPHPPQVWSTAQHVAASAACTA